GPAPELRAAHQSGRGNDYLVDEPRVKHRAHARGELRILDDRIGRAKWLGRHATRGIGKWLRRPHLLAGIVGCRGDRHFHDRVQGLTVLPIPEVREAGLAAGSNRLDSPPVDGDVEEHRARNRVSVPDVMVYGL